MYTTACFCIDHRNHRDCYRSIYRFFLLWKIGWLEKLQLEFSLTNGQIVPVLWLCINFTGFLMMQFKVHLLQLIVIALCFGSILTSFTFMVIGNTCTEVISFVGDGASFVDVLQRDGVIDLKKATKIINGIYT